MNALIQTFEHERSTIRLPSASRQLIQTLIFASVLAGGFAIASTLAFLQTSMGAAESSRIIAALAAALGWIYLGLAVDEESFRDALPDIVSFVLVTTFALLSVTGSPAFIAAAFGVHLGRAVMRLTESSEDAATRYGLVAWIGFAFGSVLIAIAAIA
jgi:hypothetical protein